MNWLTLAWANRVQLYGYAKKLKWSWRNWMRVGGLAAVGAGVYLAATHGYLHRWNPTGWSGAQWAQLVVNLMGFALLYMAQRTWWNRQDEVWDEVNQVRSEMDELREFVHGHEHVELDEDEELAPVLPVVDRIRTNELPEVSEPATVDIPIVRETVQRPLGGRTFTFRV